MHSPPNRATSPRLSTLRMGAALLAIWLTVAMSLWASQDPSLSEAEQRGVQSVVQSQLAAFAAEDADRAFALTDPDIRTKFGDAEHFMAMVRAHYPMVQRPASVLFLKPESDGTFVTQKVRLADASGEGWVATYLLRKEARDWRISACVVVPDAPHLVT
jgi:hypothetical protein